MNILYIKNNSERNEAFQLRTLIVEENGKKSVKKEVLCEAAKPHLQKMKENYEKLSNATIDPRISFAKIIGNGEKGLTFEFIEGISFEKKLKDAQKQGSSAVNGIIERYVELVRSGFETTLFDPNTMVDETFRTLFGDIDYAPLNGEPCFNSISNLDLIFSNIIFADETVYFIDYEWCFPVSLPVNYILYRTFDMLQSRYPDMVLPQLPNAFLYHKMERHFIDNYVMKDAFYTYRNNYLKGIKHLEHLQAQVEGKEAHIQELSSRLHAIGEDLAYARRIVEERDAQLQELNRIADSMRIKNRIKRLAKKLLPFMTQDDTTAVITKTPSYRYQIPKLTSQIEEQIARFEQKPLISIIMPVYNVDPKWLKKAIDSIIGQWYDKWELCIADDKSTNKKTLDYLQGLDDPRIKVRFLEENLNISGASNAALELAKGDYIALMDNDDEITPDALYEMVKCINEADADFIYSDEDFISEEGECSNPHFKPDFSPDLLLSHNYITHFTCFKKSLLSQVGTFNSTFDGSQDYDLFLRLTEKTDKICHIKKVLYHWRTLESSTSLNSEAKPEALERGRKVLIEAMRRRNIKAKVEHANMHHYFRVRYPIENAPLVSIIIPFKDKPELLEMCIGSILEKSTYRNFEIIGISNNSAEEHTFETMVSLEKRDTRVSFYEYNVAFNYADINNHAVKAYAKGEHILLLNNDIEVITPEWIEAMLEHSQREEIGCVGAKLYYPDDTVQHAGIIMGLGGYAGHSHKGYSRHNVGYFNRLGVVQNVSAVTAACLMVKKRIYEEVSGMDAIRFKVAYNDVDFCLRVGEKGYRNLFTPYAELYHHESISRGYETTPEKMARFQKEKDALFERHQKILTEGDPYYNPNLCHDKEDFSLCPQIDNI
jgi:glycosyltransferase involved in cell wall biosynthesis